MAHLLSLPLFWSPQRRVSRYSSAEFLLFKHMLATPLTTLQIAAQELITTKNNSIKYHSNSIQTLEFSLRRITDIYSFFNETNTKSVQECLPIQVIKNLCKNFCADATRLSVQVLSKSTTTKIKIHGSTFLFEEAIVCLIKNAFEAYQTRTEKIVSITIWQKQHYLYISIQDYGCGLAWWKQVLAEVPYLSFKRNGSGIGLPFARIVIEKMCNGKLLINSLPGIRTEVICVLPLSR